MAITNYAQGAIQYSIDALSVPAPTGYADGDLFILMVNSANQIIATPSGWIQVTNSPQFTGTAAAIGGNRLAVFYKWVSGTQPNLVVADTGNYTVAVIAGFRGVDPITPFDITVGDIKVTASTTITCPSVTTKVENTMIVAIVGLDRDTASSNTSGTFTNVNLTNLTRGVDYTTSLGVGGGIAFWTGFKVEGGVTETTTSTSSASQNNTYLTIALKPFVPVSVAIGVPVGQAWDIRDKYPIIITTQSTIIQSPTTSIVAGIPNPMVVIQASQSVVMTLDSTFTLRVQGELIEGFEVTLNKDEGLIINELIEGSGLNLSSSGVLTVYSLIEGEI